MNAFRRFSLAALLATTPAFADDDDLLKMVSAESDLAIHLTNTAKTKENWDKHPLKAVYESDEIKPRVEKLLKEAFDNAETENKEWLEELKKSLEKLYQEVEGEVMISLQLPEFSKKLIDEMSEGEDEDKGAVFLKNFGALVIVEAKDGEKFSEVAEEVLKILEKKSAEDPKESHEIKKEESDGAKVSVLDMVQGNKKTHAASFASLDKIGFLAIGAHDPADVINDIKKGHDKPLSKSDFLVDGPSDIQILLDLKDVWAGMKNGIDTGLSAEGMKGIRRVGVSMDISGPGIISTSRMDFPKEGLASFFIPKDPVKEPSLHAHEGILAVSQANYDLPGLYDEIMKTIKAITPMAPMFVGMQLNGLEKKLGVKLRDDLLGALAPDVEMIQFKAATPEKEAKAIGLIMGLKDQAKFEGSLKTMFGAMEMEQEKNEFLESTIYTVPMPTFGEGEKLAYAFEDGKVIMGLDSVGTVKEILKQIKKPKETLWGNDFLEDHQDLIKAGAVSLNLSDFEGQMASLFDLMGQVADDDEDPIDFSKIKIPFGSSVTSGRRSEGIFEGPFPPPACRGLPCSSCLCSGVFRTSRGQSGLG